MSEIELPGYLCPPSSQNSNSNSNFTVLIERNETRAPTNAPTPSPRSYVNEVMKVDSILTDPFELKQIGGESPDNEGANKAIDGTSDKYLVFIRNEDRNYDNPNGHPGLDVIPGQSSCTIAQGIVVYVANDSTERDPTRYVIMGRQHKTDNYELISEGDLNLPLPRNNVGWEIHGQMQFQSVTFPNTKSYYQYRIYFPSNRGNVDIFQVGEVLIPGYLCPEGDNMTLP